MGVGSAVGFGVGGGTGVILCTVFGFLGVGFWGIRCCILGLKPSCIFGMGEVAHERPTQGLIPKSDKMCRDCTDGEMFMC